MSNLRDRCGDLIATIGKLTKTIEVENQTLIVLGQGRTPTVDVDGKRQLASVYGEQMKTVQERLRAGEKIDQATSDLLNDAHTALSSIMTENRDLLRRAHTATNRMVGLIVDTARQNMPREAPPSYAAPARHQPKVGQAEQSLALNVTL
ncbi:MAG: hypothetical protein AAGF58_09270 [Pseudomonadota bacterium]